MNEIDKMRKSELADMEKPEIQASFIHAKKLLAKMRTMTIYDEDFRQILEELGPIRVWAPIVIYPPSKKVQLELTNTCSPNLIPVPWSQ